LKKNCIFVVGPESSGSTLIARIIHQALGGIKWSGRGFNCCDAGRCDEGSSYTLPCSPVGDLVCHRSLPFKDSWPPIDKWNEIYESKYILCTRDENISHSSHLIRFNWKDEQLLAKEKERALSLMKDLMYDKDIPTFIWSYETYILLGRAYLDTLADFLNIPRENFEKIEPPQNGNIKYIYRPPKSYIFAKLAKLTNR
jgi:hypothetical protein